MLKCAFSIEMNINKGINDEFFNEDIIPGSINNLNNNGLYNNYNCSSDIWNSVDNDLDTITDLLAPYEKSHKENLNLILLIGRRMPLLILKKTPTIFFIV